MKKAIDKRTILTIANNAVRKAQRESLERGIPNVYTKNGVVYFQLPDGTITMNNPYENMRRSVVSGSAEPDLRNDTGSSVIPDSIRNPVGLPGGS